MFSRGTRFPLPKVPNVPGPNAYDVHDPEYDAYKHGAFLESANRFDKEKLPAGPGPAAPDPIGNTNTVKQGKPEARSSADRYAALQRKVDELERVHTEGKKSHQAEVERLKQELSRLQKHNTEQTERYEKAKKHCDILETKGQDLKKTNDNCQAENKDLRAKLRVAEYERTQLASKQTEVGEGKKALQALDSKRRQEVRERDKKIADLEKAQATEKKRRELSEARLAEAGGKIEAGAQQAQTVATELNTELQEAKKAASKASSSLTILQSQSEATEKDLLEKLEQHRLLLSQVAKEYGRLAASTVPKDQYERLKFDLVTSQLRVNRLDRKLANAEGQVQDLAKLVLQNREQNQLLLAHLSDAESDIVVYSRALRDASITAEFDRFAERALQEDLVSLELENQRLGFAAAQASGSCLSAWTDLSQAQKEHLLSHIAPLFSYIDGQDTLVARYSDALISAEGRLRNSQATLAHLQSQQAELQQHLSDTTTHLAEASGRIHVLKEDLQRNEQHFASEIDKISASLTQEKEANKRHVSNLQKSKFAEGALEAEVDSLTSHLAEAEQYQQAYVDLLDEVDSLVKRNALAEEEAKRLSTFNAQIVGHSNPAQKIVYLDKIRRELHETKQQLLALQHDQEAAVHENDNLRRELDLYKSVAVPTTYKPRTHMTRVGRVPLHDHNVNAAKVDPANDENRVFGSLPGEPDHDGDFTIEELM